MTLFRPLRAFAFLVLASTAAHAQTQSYHVSLYAVFDFAHLSNVDRGDAATSYPSPTDEQYASFSLPTEAGGVTFHLANTGPVTLGLDIRGSGKIDYDTFFNPIGTHPNGYQALGYYIIGVQAAWNRFNRFRPYLQFSSGAFGTSTTSDLPGSSNSNDRDYLGFEGFAGLDIRILRFLDIRAAELGVANAFHVGQVNNINLNHLNVFNVSSGIVAHF